MTYKDRIFVSTFIGVMCSLLGFVSIAHISQPKLMWGLGAILGSTVIVSLVGGSLLYRQSEDSTKADAWSLVVLGVPSFIFIFFSWFFAVYALGYEYGFGSILIWLGVLAIRLLMTEPDKLNQARRPNSNTVAVAAVSGAIVPSLMSAVGILNQKTFIFVVCNLILSCGLGYAAAYSAKNLLKRSS